MVTSTFPSRAGRSLAVAAVLVVCAPWVACGGDDGLGSLGPSGADPGSVQAFVARAAHDPDGPPFASYFSLDRYRARADLPEDVAEEDLLAAVFVDGEADPTIASPFVEMLRLFQFEPVVLPLSTFHASYADESVPGDLLLADVEPDALVAALEDDVGPVEESEVGDVTVYRAAQEREPGGDDPVAANVFAGTAIAVDGDAGEVVFGADGDGTEAVADDEDDTARVRPGVTEVARALDQAGVYAASLLFDAADAGGGDGPLESAWARGAAGTALDEDGRNVAVTVLWHDAEGDAADNAGPLAEIMDESPRCTGGAEVETDGGLLVASCPYDGQWASDVLTRYPLGPLFA
ncbi:hypothetical protein [Iamia sp.]|uniref:hypothetical protein n=1 Tax=Iamia sp. TaxID=2722710 RepID=UPI002C69EC43|nr:hypothetical protein [Iamia sp.]HXH57254.1 hypothetical protein [Iamia sp.]